MRKLPVAVFTVILAGGLVVFSDKWYPTMFASNIGSADRVVVLKSEREMLLYSGEDVLASYSIALGQNPIGHKIMEGDSRTPEGGYVLDWRNINSKYYRSIHISYPNAVDKQNAVRNGVSPGGDIMIHGQPNGLGIMGIVSHAKDWTGGCIAVSNREMEEIWRSVSDGTPIEINPWRDAL